MKRCYVPVTVVLFCLCLHCNTLCLNHCVNNIKVTFESQKSLKFVFKCAEKVDSEKRRNVEKLQNLP